MFGGLSLRLTNLVQKFKLLLSIINLLLLDTTIDDTVQRGQVTLVVLSRFGESLDGRVVVTQESFLSSQFRMVRCIFWLLSKSHIDELLSLQ